jgi:hydrophobic/amphiphilic exporter-1 (mainly G- bacteria), HAE1 family
MTTFSMIIAMLPIAMATGSGSVWKNGLAWVLVGGLSSSLFLSLVIVPIVYCIAERGKEKVTGYYIKLMQK